MADNRCVICGEVIPEGFLVCPNCESKSLNQQLETQIEIAKQTHKAEKRDRMRDTVDYIMWDWVIPLLTGGFILYILFGRW